MAFHATVLQVIPELATGGAERTTIDVARAIVEAGGAAVVATRGGRMVPELLKTGAIVETVAVDSKNPLQLWQNRSRLISLIKKHRIDIVHARSRAPAWSALGAARKMDVPFITTYHGYYAAKAPLKKFYNSVMARGDLVIANSEFIRDHVAVEHGAPTEKIITIPRGIDMTRFHADAVSRDRIAALIHQWGIDEHDKRIRVVLPGRLTPWKGQAILIDAAARLRDAGQGGEFSVILVGDAQGRDGYLRELRALIDARDLEDMVSIVGHCDDMPAAYLLADIVVSASVRPEAFGRVAVEAQAMGRPVVATDHGGSRETVEPHVTGWLAPPGDPTALAEALMVFHRMSLVGRAQMGRAAREYVENPYSLDTMCASTLKAYRTAMFARS